jgi:hypothetical protein
MHSTSAPCPCCASVLQARTRRLAEKRIPKEELEEMERRRRAEEAEDRQGMMATLRCRSVRPSRSPHGR